MSKLGQAELSSYATWFRSASTAFLKEELRVHATPPLPLSCLPIDRCQAVLRKLDHPWWSGGITEASERQELPSRQSRKELRNIICLAMKSAASAAAYSLTDAKKTKGHTDSLRSSLVSFHNGVGSYAAEFADPLSYVLTLYPEMLRSVEMACEFLDESQEINCDPRSWFVAKLALRWKDWFGQLPPIAANSSSDDSFYMLLCNCWSSAAQLNVPELPGFDDREFFSKHVTEKTVGFLRKGGHLAHDGGQHLSIVINAPPPR